MPGLFVLPTRCLENELLHPPLLSRALDQSGHAASEPEIRSLLRRIADEQYDDIHASMVNEQLYRAGEERVTREPGESAAAHLRRRLEARRSTSQSRLMAVAEVSVQVEKDLQKRWDRDRLSLLDGKVALPRVAQELAPGFRGLRGLEAALVRQAVDNPPPGVAALRETIARLVG